MVDYSIELVFVPVADTDRSRAFYGDTLWWPVDHDVRVSDELRFVQVTPPGSACSIAFGEGIGGGMAPGTLRALQVVVASADEARADLVARGGRRLAGGGPRLGPVRALRRPGRQHVGGPGAAEATRLTSPGRTRRPHAAGPDGGPVRTVGTYSRSWSFPSKVRLDVRWRATSGQPS